MSIIDEIYDTRLSIIELNKPAPQSIGMSYDDGVKLLEESREIFFDRGDFSIQEMLMRNDRTEITAHLNNMYVYGMKIIISDIVKI